MKVLISVAWMWRRCSLIRIYFILAFAIIVIEKSWINKARAMSSVALGSRSRVYADVNTHKPREYWDYESHPIEWG